MATRLDGSGIFSGIYSGLNSTYAMLAQQYPDGVTLESFTNKDANKNLANNYLNPSFKQYMQTNFAKIDKDGDGVISEKDMSTLTNQMAQQGMTRDQLAQLGGANGYSTEQLTQIMTHFNDIDANKDGKVTNAEIQAYGVTSDKENKLTEYMHQKATNMSMFYGSESSSSSESSSLLDYKYLKSKS